MKVPCHYLLVFVGCVIGCGPAVQPVWNKDSRSFFYGHADGSVCQYDLDKQASRTLLSAGTHPVMEVGLSPTRPSVAFAQTALGDNGRAVQVGIASLGSGKVTWSKLEVWGDPQAQRKLSSASCFWCPTGKRVLIWYQGTGENPGATSSWTFFGRFALYDVASGKLSELSTTAPAVMLGQLTHSSPLCPDGSGYVAMKLVEKGPQFSFVTWDGWEHPLEIDQQVLRLINLVADSKASEEDKSRAYFPLPEGGWVENTLRFSLREGTIVIDPKNRKISLEPLTAAQKSQFDQVSAADAADVPWITFQFTRFRDSEFELHCRLKLKEPTLPARIELVDTKLLRRRVILQGRLPENFLAHHLIPSPDGQHTLVCLRDEQGTKNWIHVIQRDGTMVTKVDAGPVASGAGSQ